MKKLLILGSIVLVLTACDFDSDSKSNKSDKPVVTKPVVTKPIAPRKEYSITANHLNAKSIAVIDGDTVRITDERGSTHTVRLLGIDAPESLQSYGSQSIATLQECIADAIVNVEWISKNHNGRLLGKVMANGVDCNLEQVKKGSAWHYKAYQDSQSPLDRALYSNAEIDARSAINGLWSDLYAVAPWNYRKGISPSESHDNTKSETKGLSAFYDSVNKDTVNVSNVSNDTVSQLIIVGKNTYSNSGGNSNSVIDSSNNSNPIVW